MGDSVAEQLVERSMGFIGSDDATTPGRVDLCGQELSGPHAAVTPAIRSRDHHVLGIDRLRFGFQVDRLELDHPQRPLEQPVESFGRQLCRREPTSPLGVVDLAG